MNPIFDKKVLFGISSRIDGNMRLLDDKGIVMPTDKKRDFFRNNNLNIDDAVFPNLVHGNNVVNISSKDRGRIIENCDALITNEKGLISTITIADCLPIYFYDPVKKVVAIAHAGWRGVISLITKKVIGRFLEDYGSNFKDILVYIGPHIQKCHFEITNEIIDNFVDYNKFISFDKKILVDLSGITRQQLIESGVQGANIRISSECTYCLHQKYFSYRRDKPTFLETMIAYIVIK